jgi:cytochrome c2
MTIKSFGAVIAIGGMMLSGSMAWADEASALYDKKCKVCHSLKGDAGKFAEKGGPLDGIGSKRDEAWLRAYFADPKSKLPEAKMPKIKLSPAEWDSLVAYMLSLK